MRIDCRECNEYAQLIFDRGEITQDEINNLVMNRHILRGCKEAIANEIRKTEDHLIELREMLNA
ncbi:MAG: hypothetical protein WA324_27750 [Bryobacteraceae bacterium]